LELVTKYKTQDGLVWDEAGLALEHEKKLMSAASTLVASKEYFDNHSPVKWSYSKIIDELADPCSRVELVYYR
jgi:hypothetical protein